MQATCEYLKNPVGIDMAKPRFSWTVPESYARQLSYQVLVYEKDTGDAVWDSGVVDSGSSVNIEYGGSPLKTAKTYDYTVKVRADDGSVFESAGNTFTMGIMDDPVWKAPWIGGPGMEIYAFWFRSAFYVDKPVKSAYVYVVSPNYYTLTVNGKKCGDSVLTSPNTDPAKTMLYSTYDVKAALLSGENVFGVELANGWKALNLGRTGVGLGEHLFSLQMFLEYEDGEQKWILSDPSEWKYTRSGPVLANNVYQGEDYDSTLIVKGWDEPGFDFEASGVEWSDAVEFEPEEGRVKSAYLEPPRVVAELVPVEIRKIADGSYTFDMGQNFAGWARLRVHGTRGNKIKLVYSELIFDDWNVNQITLRNMRCTDTYVLSGNGEETYEPSYTFHGFRYVQVYGLEYEPDSSLLTGCVVRSDVDRIGSFSCDNALINKLQQNICWTEESNLMGLPTDCPQRDERLGWINDMTVRNECALYNYKLVNLYTKWLGDIRDTQGEKTGAISDTAPFRVFGCRPADPVGASLILLPWNLYLYYHDERVLAENYTAIRKFLCYIERNCTDHIVRWAHMGDWASPIGENDAGSIGGGAVSVMTPPRLVATAYFYYECNLMVKIASVLGKQDDVDYFGKLAGQVREAFLKTYYNPETNSVGKNSQSANTIALYFDLIPQEDRAGVLKNLVYDIAEVNNYHLTTGNMCSRYIIEVLLTNGYEDVAYKLLTQTTYPSWGFMIEKGATTVWERWEQIVSESSLSIMASYNHPMYGAVGVCFYKYLAGIQTDETRPGFENVIVRPVVPSGIHHVEASMDSVRGKIVSKWDFTEQQFVLDVEFPFNSNGKVCIPDVLGGKSVHSITVDGLQSSGCFEDGCTVFVLPAGKHQIVCC